MTVIKNENQMVVSRNVDPHYFPAEHFFVKLRKSENRRRLTLKGFYRHRL